MVDRPNADLLFGGGGGGGRVLLAIKLTAS